MKFIYLMVTLQTCMIGYLCAEISSLKHIPETSPVTENLTAEKDSFFTLSKKEFDSHPQATFQLSDKDIERIRVALQTPIVAKLETPVIPPQVQEANENGNRYVDALLSKSYMTGEDQRELTSTLAGMSGEEIEQSLLRVASAINSGQLKLQVSK